MAKFNMYADDGSVILHPSSFPTWDDCARRTAAKSFRELILHAGFNLRRIAGHVGAVIGIAVHAGVATTLKMKMMTGELGPFDDVVDLSINTMDESIGDGVTWDLVTPHSNDGEKQVIRMLRSYRNLVAPHIEPIAVEERVEVNVTSIVSRAMILSGQSDSMSREPGRIIDTKTGVRLWGNAQQYGAYSLIARSKGHEINQIVEDYIPRAPVAKPQPEPSQTIYDVGASEHAAIEVIKDMDRSLTEFERRLTAGDAPPESAFRANPNSVLCSPRFCPAHGTDFCKIHKKDN